MCLSLIIKGWTKNEVNPIRYCGIWISIEGPCIYTTQHMRSFYARKKSFWKLLQCFASWLSMCKVEMALINISSSN